MEKVLITGANGYIGGYLQGLLKERYHIITTDISPHQNFQFWCGDIHDLTRENYFPCDLLDKPSVLVLLEKVLPDVIIHCAGTKDIFGCEKNPEEAHRVNVDTTKNFADNIKGSNIKFVFLSSDYVFSGDRGMYCEEDVPNPKTVYGRTKLICEEYIKKLSNYAICRTANVYGMGSKFFDFILNSLKGNKEIDMYYDSYFSPTYINNLADMLDAVIAKDINGILHTAGPERVNRHEFALRIAKHFGLDKGLVKAISKPKDSPLADDSSLNIDMSSKRLGMRFIGIDEGLEYIGG